MTDCQKAATNTGRYLLGGILLAYALVEIHREQAPTAKDPHVWLAGAALLIMPDVAGWIAENATKVGRALVDVYKAKKEADK